MLWNIWRLINTIASIFHKNMLAYLSLGIICSSKLTVFLELHSQKTVQILEQIIPRDKYLCIFLCQIEAIVYLFWENCIPSKSWDAQLKQCLVDHHFNLIHADCLFHFCLLLWRRNIQNVSNSNCLYQITNLYIKYQPQCNICPLTKYKCSLKLITKLTYSLAISILPFLSFFVAHMILEIRGSTGLIRCPWKKVCGYHNLRCKFFYLANNITNQSCTSVDKPIFI